MYLTISKRQQKRILRKRTNKNRAENEGVFRDREKNKEKKRSCVIVALRWLKNIIIKCNMLT